MSPSSDPATRQDPPPWDLVKDWFGRALERPVDEREAFMRLGGAPAAVQREVLSLLSHAGDDAGDPMHVLLPALPAPPLLAPGLRLGAWEVVGPLGHGGMAEVHLARRADGAWQGEAAVKVIKRGMNSAAVLARFALEQRALARLAHPHIARLLDAGRTDDGLPYFVMEKVDGEPIDRAAARLPVERRIDLFLQLADAVAYAHRLLLVHRDLKPSNVLVTRDGQVKLLDFGIAKALDPAETEGAEHTVAGQRPFTPYFASPEQVCGEPVGTATDVYSLGVLLYLMLTGRRPYGRDADTASAAARSVLEDAPTRPSALPAPDVPPSAAAAEPVPDWDSLRRRLRGDLDNILLKALEKPVERRYPSVEALAQDLRWHLAGWPVSARAPSWRYRAGKFIRRNRAAVGAGAALAAVLCVGVAALAWQARQTELARQAADQRFADVRRLANRLVFRYHDQIVNLPGATSVRSELLDDALVYLDALHQHVGRDRALARELAETYFRIGVLQGEAFSPSLERLDAAQRSFDKAAALLPLYVDDAALDAAGLKQAVDLRLAQGSLAARRGQPGPARQALQQARTLAERALRLHPEDMQALSGLATLEGQLGMLVGGNSAGACLGRVSEAVPHFEAALHLMRLLRQREPQQAEWVHQLAWAHHIAALAAVLRADHARAVLLAEQAVALRDQAARMAPDNAHFRHQRAVARLGLATALALAGRHERVPALLDEVDAIGRASVAADADNKAAQRDLRAFGITRGRTLVLAGRLAQARAVLERTLDGLPAVPPQQDFYAARGRADALLWAARAWRPVDPVRAAALAEEALGLLGQPTDPSNASHWWLLAQAWGERAQAQATLGRHTDAVVAAQQAMRAWAQGSPEGAPPGLYQAWWVRDRQLAQDGR
ncbi:MAG: serine/threonine protein kinase [Burkholderiales bacterium]|nr:serine/threonine protein kinase [Burkholderiales bacterium]